MLAQDRVLHILLTSLGLPQPGVTRWGPVRNLFAALIDAAGRCAADPCFTGDANKSVGCIQQPRLLFVLDWLMRDTRWRQLDQLLAPTVASVLSDMAAGELRSVTAPVS